MLRKLRDFAWLFQKAAENGVLLFAAAIIAMIFANSNLNYLYQNFVHSHISLTIGEVVHVTTLLDVVNNCLMTIFFFVIGMEMKRELVNGYLSTTQQRILPVVAAISGVIVPIIIYNICSITSRDYHSAVTNGWAIPTATDIAFTLGAMSIFCKNIPKRWKIFVTALAIIDDLIAVFVIALFYGNSYSPIYLILVILCILVLLFLNRVKITAALPYVIVGVLLWFCMMNSGVHATLAGVIFGIIIPISIKKNDVKNIDDDRCAYHEEYKHHKVHMIKIFEKVTQPMVTYMILPLFAFMNSGISFVNIDISMMLSPVTLGIAAGLFFGKQIGIFGMVTLLIKIKFVSLDGNTSNNILVNDKHTLEHMQSTSLSSVYIASVLCGIGFTMSIFISLLAFEHEPSLLNEAKLGVILGSVLSLLYGVVLSIFFGTRRESVTEKKMCESILHVNTAMNDDELNLHKK